MPFSSNIELLKSYTHSASKLCIVFRPKTIEQLVEMVEQFNKRGEPFCMMGGGNSFGDVFIPRYRHLIDCSDLNKILSFDASNGDIGVECGVQSGPLSAMLLDNGRYLTGAAGSLTNTIAGDISSNVNGKDSWKFGNYSSNVKSFDLLTTKGKIIHVKEDTPELFWGAMGGLGMLGIIVSANLNASRAQSNHLLVDSVVTKNLEDTIRVFKNLGEDEWDFAYAWVDVLGEKSTIGRAIVERARFDTTSSQLTNANEFSPKSRILGLKDSQFWCLYRGVQSILRATNSDRSVAQVVNAVHYHASRIKAKQRTAIPLTSYQYPMLKALPNWNKGISSYGMQEVQMLFHQNKFSSAFIAIQTLLQRYKIYPLISAIRKHKGDQGLLSFSGNGLSFTINYDRISFPNSSTGFRMERELIALVIAYNGKVYLSKFPYVTSSECEAMYEGVSSMRMLKSSLDPNNLLRSNSSTRLLGL